MSPTFGVARTACASAGLMVRHSTTVTGSTVWGTGKSGCSQGVRLGHCLQLWLPTCNCSCPSFWHLPHEHAGLAEHRKAVG